MWKLSSADCCVGAGVCGRNRGGFGDNTRSGGSGVGYADWRRVHAVDPDPSVRHSGQFDLVGERCAVSGQNARCQHRDKRFSGGFVAAGTSRGRRQRDRRQPGGCRSLERLSRRSVPSDGLESRCDRRNGGGQSGRGGAGNGWTDIHLCLDPVRCRRRPGGLRIGNGSCWSRFRPLRPPAVTTTDLRYAGQQRTGGSGWPVQRSCDSRRVGMSA